MNNSTSSEQAKIDAEIAVAATRASVKNAAQSVTDSASAVKEQAKEKMAEFKDRNPTTNANASAGICCRLFAHRLFKYFACDIY